VTLDPIVLATGIGIVASPVAGRALVHGFESVPRRWRRPTIWLLSLGAAAAAAVAELAPEGPVKAAVFVILLGALPGIIAFVVWRTALASALVSMVPLYFGIGALTLERPVHTPEIALDGTVPLEPAWMVVYGSLYGSSSCPCSWCATSSSSVAP
jgi:hypothetical protein